MGRYIDLTGPLVEGMWHYRGPFPSFSAETIATPASHGYRATALRISTHMGTHMDAPRHYWDDAASADRMPLDKFAGPGRLLPLWDYGEPLAAITPEALVGAGADALVSGEVALVATGWDRHWLDPSYSARTPFLTLEAAAYLVSRGIRLLGTDTALCCDPRVGEAAIADGVLIPDHVLLQAGIPYVNGLCNLRELPASGFTFYGFPLRIAGGDGAPMRAVAHVAS